jgi:glyoxylase-like metal-dependent hydrolase (beta-lactamase superfamily II)
MTEPTFTPLGHQRLDHQIVRIDSGFYRAGCASVYVIHDQGQVAIVETGTGVATVPVLLEALATLGFAREDVMWVVVTHVHLDHAGGAGALLQHLPQARLAVHPLGAVHMIDPSRLEQSSRMVYGDDVFDRVYGAIPPVPAGRVVQAEDGQIILLGERPLQLIHTPGHARHHLCVWDERSRGVFTGDAFGIAYREVVDVAGNPLFFPATTPTQWDPPAMVASMERLDALQPRWLFLTHFGAREYGPEVLEHLRQAVWDWVEIAEACRGIPVADGERHRQLLALLSAWMVRHAGNDASGVAAWLEMDLELDAQGIGHWLDRTGRERDGAR